MAINAVGHREDAWDKVAKALAIANQGVGIVSGVQSIRASSQKMDDEQATQDRIKNGVVTPKEQLEFSKDYNQSDAQGPGSFHLKTPEGKDVYYSPKEKSKSADSTALSQKDVAEFQNKGFGLVAPGARGSTLYSAVGPDGKIQQIGLVPPKLEDAAAKAAKEPKGDQYKVALFGKRMEQAEGDFNDLAEKGYDPTSLSSGAQRTTVLGLGVPDRFKSEDVKRQEQAERNFVNAVLRRESGAAISPTEFDSAAKQYFPRAGDSAAVLQQKADNRALAIQGFRAEAGPAWAQYSAQPSTTAIAKQGKERPSSLVESAQAGSGKASTEDLQALKWAQANPKDPRAREIMSHVKGKGL